MRSSATRARRNLADAVRWQFPVSGEQLLEAGLSVAAARPVEVGGEILDMHLDSRPVRSDQLDWHPSFLPDQESVLVVAAQRDLDELFFGSVSVLRHHEESVGRPAGFDSSRPLPAAGKETCVVFATQAEFALDLSVPDRQASMFGQCGPHLTDSPLKTILKAHHALPIPRSETP